MYAALWRVLPGPGWVKVTLALVLFAVVVLACFRWIFPALAPHMPYNDNVVEQAQSAQVRDFQ